MAKTTTKRSSDAVGNVRAVADGICFEGKDWDAFADALNANGVSTTTGKEWTVANIKRFCERNIPELLQPPETNPVKRPTTILRKRPGAAPKEKQTESVKNQIAPAPNRSYDTVESKEKRSESVKTRLGPAPPRSKDIIESKEKRTEAVKTRPDPPPPRSRDIIESKEARTESLESPPRRADEVDYDGLPRPASQVKQTLRKGHHIPVFSDPQPTILEDPAPEPIPAPTVAQFDEETLVAIREIVQWWCTGGRAAEKAVSNAKAINYRPVFPGKRKNTGVRINQKLLDDALAKAKSPDEATRTGGGLSPLIEFLLWQYLGFGEKYVKS